MHVKVWAYIFNFLIKAISMFKKKYPFLKLAHSIVVLRITVSCIFLAHAITRVATNTIIQFGDFLEIKGLPFGIAIVWGITIFEILGAILLMLGFFKKWIALGLIVMLTIGMGLIHINFGWFNGEFGTGGCEYSVTLIAALIVIASSDETQERLK